MRSPHRRQPDRERAAALELVQVDPLVDRVRFVLAGAEGDGRNAVPVHPVRVEPAIGGADVRRAAPRGDRRSRTFDRRQAVLDADVVEDPGGTSQA